MVVISTFYIFDNDVSSGGMGHGVFKDFAFYGRLIKHVCFFSKYDLFGWLVQSIINKFYNNRTRKFPPNLMSPQALSSKFPLFQRLVIHIPHPNIGTKYLKRQKYVILIFKSTVTFKHEIMRILWKATESIIYIWEIRNGTRTKSK